MKWCRSKGCDGGTGTEQGTRGLGFVPGVERLGGVGGETQVDSVECAFPSYSFCVTKKLLTLRLHFTKVVCSGAFDCIAPSV